MNIILFEPQEVETDRITVHDRRSSHIKNVLKAVPGDRVRVGIINGGSGTGIVTEISDKSVTLKLAITDSEPQRPMTDLILALPRPIMLKRVLAQAAALGVGRIFLINAKRVEKSFFHASLLKEESYREYLIQGLEQAIDTLLPKVTIHTRFKPFIEDELPKLTEYANRLIAHPAVKQEIWQQEAPRINGKIVLAIGPEGGWLDYEMEKFREQGFSAFSLGPRILRVDTAVPAILSQISLLRSMSQDRL
jgi:RsmE family RNA methyltransferase